MAKRKKTGSRVVVREFTEERFKEIKPEDKSGKLSGKLKDISEIGEENPEAGFQDSGEGFSDFSAGKRTVPVLESSNDVQQANLEASVADAPSTRTETSTEAENQQVYTANYINDYSRNYEKREEEVIRPTVRAAGELFFDDFGQAGVQNPWQNQPARIQSERIVDRNMERTREEIKYAPASDSKKLPFERKKREI